MITRFSIVTLIFFFISNIFVIKPLSFHVSLPVICQRRVPLTVGLKAAPIMAIAILWASQCLEATQIRNGIVGTDNSKPYSIPILFISLAYMAITLDDTGILLAAAFWLSNKGGSKGRKLYFYLYLLITVISLIVGKDPAIVSGTVFLAHYTATAGLSPEAWLVSEFAAVSTASMVLFVGNPTNLVICQGFRINDAAFTAYTVFPFVACSVVCYLVLMLQYRGEKHIPKKLNVSGKLNPREVVRDPVNATFGSIWLATCLIVAIVLSFFHVEAWMVVLPFAGGKFIFDISRDHYKYSKGRVAISVDNTLVTAFRHLAMPDNMEGHAAINTCTGIPHHDISSAPKDSDNDLLPDDFMPAANMSRHDADEDGTMNTSTPYPHLGTSSPENSTNTHPYDSQPRTSPRRLESTSLAAPSLNNILERAEDPPTPPSSTNSSTSTLTCSIMQELSVWLRERTSTLAMHFPTFFTALPRLPFGLIPFVFSQFILIEALEHQGWINIFARCLVTVSNKQAIPVVWLVGVFGVILCNISGTNIGATILLTKIIRASDFPEGAARAAAVSLAVASNIGAVGTFSASLAGLSFVAVLNDKGVKLKQWRFAMWNTLPLIAMTAVGLGVVSAMMAVLY